MNRLISPAPESVEIDGIEYPLNTNWQDCISIIMAYEDPELTPQERVETLIVNLYDPPYPDNIDKAAELGMKFLDCGMDNSKTDKRPTQRLYSFYQDATYIYAAMYKQGEIPSKLHFWDWFARFLELGESVFSNIMRLRYMKLNGVKMSKEDLKQCEQIGWDVINLQQTTNEDKAINDYINSD